MQFKSILVISNRLLGDSIDSLHSIASLVRENPQAKYSLVGYKYSAFLMDELIEWEDIFYLRKNHLAIGDFFKIYFKFRNKVDLVYILPGGWGWAFLAWMLRGRVRVGHDGDMRKLFLTHTTSIIRSGNNYKNFDNLYKLLYSGGRFAQGKLPVKKVDIKKLGIKKRFVIFSILASENYKIWPKEYFLELATKIQEDNPVTDVVFIGSPGEREVVAQILDQSSFEGVNLAGKLDLPEVFYLISKAAYFIGNDSGLTHGAALLGTINYSIIGPTNPTLSFPFDPHRCSRFIYHEPSGITHEERRKKKYRKLLAIDKIGVDKVWKVINKDQKERMSSKKK